MRGGPEIPNPTSKPLTVLLEILTLRPWVVGRYQGLLHDWREAVSDQLEAQKKERSDVEKEGEQRKRMAVNAAVHGESIVQHRIQARERLVANTSFSSWKAYKQSMDSVRSMRARLGAKQLR